MGHDLGVRALPVQCFSCTKGPKRMVGEGSVGEDERREGGSEGGSVAALSF